jgi:hypothetical protein
LSFFNFFTSPSPTSRFGFFRIFIPKELIVKGIDTLPEGFGREMPDLISELSSHSETEAPKKYLIIFKYLLKRNTLICRFFF